MTVRQYARVHGAKWFQIVEFLMNRDIFVASDTKLSQSQIDLLDSMWRPTAPMSRDSASLGVRNNKYSRPVTLRIPLAIVILIAAALPAIALILYKLLFKK